MSEGDTAVSETRRGRAIHVEQAPGTGLWRIRIEGGGVQPFAGELFNYHNACHAVEVYKQEKG